MNIQWDDAYSKWWNPRRWFTRCSREEEEISTVIRACPGFYCTTVIHRGLAWSISVNGETRSVELTRRLRRRFFAEILCSPTSAPHFCSIQCISRGVRCFNSFFHYFSTVHLDIYFTALYVRLQKEDDDSSWNDRDEILRMKLPEIRYDAREVSVTSLKISELNWKMIVFNETRRAIEIGPRLRENLSEIFSENISVRENDVWLKRAFRSMGDRISDLPLSKIPRGKFHYLQLRTKCHVNSLSLFSPCKNYISLLTRAPIPVKNRYVIITPYVINVVLCRGCYHYYRDYYRYASTWKPICAYSLKLKRNSSL